MNKMDSFAEIMNISRSLKNGFKVFKECDIWMHSSFGHHTTQSTVKPTNILLHIWLRNCNKRLNVSHIGGHNGSYLERSALIFTIDME